VLGGVHIRHPAGLLGHSDADVVAHAVADAVLGAAGLGDIGQLFPDDDPAYEGADSLQLLERVVTRAAAAGYAIGNVDVVVVCQAPRLAPHRALMAVNLARALRVTAAQVSVKATTTEGMGYEGRGDGISATAVCLLTQSQPEI
jgi:2-C-methyl-D-erythritol 2,4-cyclodiphosphate synthase